MSVVNQEPTNRTGGPMDWRKTQLQETGWMPVTGLTVAEVLGVLDELGIEPAEAFLAGGGNLRVDRLRTV